MREIRPSGSEGGAGRKPRSYLYLLTRSEELAGVEDSVMIEGLFEG